MSRIEETLYDVAGEDPYQSFESNDAKDYHWGFDSSEDAIELIERFKSVAEDPTVIVLRLSSRDTSLESFTVKDARRLRH